MKTKIRAVAYVRVSTRDQKNGLQAQRAAINAWAEREGVTVSAWFEDRGVSGSVAVDERPGLIDALAAVKHEQGAALVVAKRDRLARSVMVAAVAEHLVRKAGGRIVSADGIGAEDTPEGELLRGMLDVFAQYERALIRARTRAALAVRRQAGKKTGHLPPFGWRHEGEEPDSDGVMRGGVLVEDEGEQAARNRILELRAAGTTFRQIAAVLEREGHKPRGKAWHPSLIHRILKAEPA